MNPLAVVTLEELRTIDLFDDLDDGQLSEWLPVVQPLLAEPGDILAEHGEPTPGVFLMFEGTIETFLMSGDHAEPAGRNFAPTWMGAIGVLTQGALGVRIQAETAVRAGRVAPEDFRRLAFAQPAVHRRVMEVVAPVMSRITAIEQNRERLTSLGTMAAGLAHELNNPAAAAGRAAAQMVEAVDIVSATLRRFVESGIEREQAAALVALHSEAIERAAGRTALDALDAADAEDALLERLEALGVPEPWKLAEPLAAAGLDEAWLERVAALAGTRHRCRTRVGGGDAYGAQPRGRVAGGDAPDVEPRRRRQVLRLHGSWRHRRNRPARGAGDDDHGARPPAQAHLDQARARLRP